MEFAITLPVVLVLMFGVIEFGRIFQSWVSLQNAARTAARYASTGSYEPYFRGALDTTNPDSDIYSLVPCSKTISHARGVKTLYYALAGTTLNAVTIFDNDSGRTGGNVNIDVSEEIFTTWYGGIDCDPRPPQVRQLSQLPDSKLDHNDLRSDILRLMAIYEEAHKGASGLQIDPSIVTTGLVGYDYPASVIPATGATWRPKTWTSAIDTPQEVRAFLFSNWSPFTPQFRPTVDDSPNEFDQSATLRGYFSVNVCSSRGFLRGDSTGAYVYDATAAYNPRFLSIIDPYEVYRYPALLSALQQISAAYDNDGNGVADGDANLWETRWSPGCFLNEEFATNDTDAVDSNNSFNVANNAGRRWLDPGSGGDRVSISVQFYHPLITPLGLAEYIPLRARRAAIVEDFRGSNSVAALSNARPAFEPGSNDDPTVSAPVVPSVIVPTVQASVVPTLVASSVPATTAFSCDRIQFVDIDFDAAARLEAILSVPSITGNPDSITYNSADAKLGFQPDRVMFRIQNGNPLDVPFRSVDLNWERDDYPADNGAPVPSYPGMYMDRFAINGAVMWDGSDDVPNTSNLGDGGQIPGGYFITANSLNNWEATYTNGPVNLEQNLPRTAFSGTTFVFSNPLNPSQTCTKILNFALTNIDPNNDVYDGTPTPEDCANTTVDFAAAANPFQDNGWVQLIATNNRNFPAPIRDFSVTWGRWEDRAQSGTVLLQRIVVGGSDPDSGTTIWSAPSAGASITRTDPSATCGSVQNACAYTSVTKAYTGSTWSGGSGGFAIPPGATRNVWLDFNGDNLSLGRGFILSDLNGTQMTIGCGSTGTGGGGGGGSAGSGIVDIFNYATPDPTVDAANDPPRAQADSYSQGATGTGGTGPVQQFQVGSGVTHTIPAADGVIQNSIGFDTDCFDDSPGRAVVGTPCTESNDTWNYANGDTPLRITNYYIVTTDRKSPGNNLTTTLGGTINFPTTNVNGVSSALGNFTYIPPGTNSANYCTMAAGTTDNDTFTYTVSDSRNATATATVTLTIKTPDAAPNQKPSSSGLTITYGNYTNTPSTYTSAENWLTSAYNANQGGAITSSSFLSATQGGNNFAFNTAVTLPSNRGTLSMNTTTGVVTFTPGSYYGTAAAIGTTNYDISIKVTDNGGRGTACSETTNTLRITVTGNYVAPTTAPAQPTSETGGQTNGGI